jgi:hypothetical protein
MEIWTNPARTSVIGRDPDTVARAIAHEVR